MKSNSSSHSITVASYPIPSSRNRIKKIINQLVDSGSVIIFTFCSFFGSFLVSVFWVPKKSDFSWCHALTKFQKYGTLRFVIFYCDRGLASPDCLLGVAAIWSQSRLINNATNNTNK